jgi:phage-related protein
MVAPKPFEFVDSSLGDLRAFPLVARRRAGYELARVQLGLDPDDWKPMPSIGPGVARDPSASRRVDISSDVRC